MNNVTHATDSQRTFVWETYVRHPKLGEPAYRIRMSYLLWDCDLVRVYRVSDSRWVGVVTRVSLNRRIKIVLNSVDVAVLERTLGRKLVHGEVFSNPVNLTCVRYEGLTLYGIDSANIGNGVVRREDVAAIAIPTKLQRMQWILDTLRERRDLCQVQDMITSVRIECRDSARKAIERLIAPYSDGIAINWKTYTVQTFYGTMEETQERKAG